MGALEVTDAKIVQEKLAQAVTVVQEKSIDLWLTFVRETSHVADPCLRLLLGFDLTWQSALMVSRGGDRIAIVGRYDEDNVRRMGGYTDVTKYDKSIREPLLEELSKLDPKVIAVNFSCDDPSADGLTYGMLKLLENILDGTRFAGRIVSAEEIIRSVRGRKSPGEIARIRSAVRAAEAVFCRAGRKLQPGMSESAVASVFQDETSSLQLGLAWDPASCPGVTAGPNSPVGHAMPTEETLKPGHLLQVDFGVRKEGFVCDLQRTWYQLERGETGPPQAVKDAWGAVTDALEAGRAALRSGLQGWKVDEVARTTLVRRGFPEFLHAFGHQVGRAAHDGGTLLGPHWEKYGKAVDGVVEVGNVFAIELGVSVPGRGYIGREENVLVAEDGAEYLSDPQTELWCF
jgi:Xaa-Pro aminopeptidase